MKRFLAAILTVLMLLGTMTIGISAKKITPVYQIDDQTKKETEEIDYEKTLEKYLTTEFNNPEEKLAEMDLMYEKDGYQLWVDKFTGEEECRKRPDTLLQPIRCLQLRLRLGKEAAAFPDCYQIHR